MVPIQNKEPKSTKTDTPVPTERLTRSKSPAKPPALTKSQLITSAELIIGDLADLPSLDQLRILVAEKVGRLVEDLTLPKHTAWLREAIRKASGESTTAKSVAVSKAAEPLTDNTINGASSAEVGANNTQSTPISFSVLLSDMSMADFGEGWQL